MNYYKLKYVICRSSENAYDIQRKKIGKVDF